MLNDVLIVGGGPAGLAAALALGRARKRVLLCDEEAARRNASATHLHNFVTRDGTPPAEFRRIGREQLAAYSSVQLRASRVDRIDGERGNFSARLADGSVVHARRVLLCTGVIDDLPNLPGLRELWGTSVFQCPYCHGWEVQGARFAYWASNIDTTEFAIFLRGWTDDVVLLTSGTFTIPDAVRTRLAAAGVRLDERVVERLEGDDRQLRNVVFATGESLPRDVLVLHPPQRQVPLVDKLQLAADARGFVQVDDARRTSRAGIYAAGDLTTHAQAATLAAAAGMQAAAALNHELTIELVTAGVLT